MWLLIALSAAWCAMACLEYLHWWCFDRVIELAIEASRAREAVRNFQVLSVLESTITLAEHLYEETSAVGCPYPAHTRRNIAAALSGARMMFQSRVGQAPVWVLRRGMGSWPFNREGKVTL